MPGYSRVPNRSNLGSTALNFTVWRTNPAHREGPNNGPNQMCLCLPG
jgi:hypothetical protein